MQQFRWSRPYRCVSSGSRGAPHSSRADETQSCRSVSRKAAAALQRWEWQPRRRAPVLLDPRLLPAGCAEGAALLPVPRPALTCLERRLLSAGCFIFAGELVVEGGRLGSGKGWGAGGADEVWLWAGLPQIFSLLGDLFSVHQRAFVAALVQVAIFAGMSIGQLVAGLIGAPPYPPPPPPIPAPRERFDCTVANDETELIQGRPHELRAFGVVYVYKYQGLLGSCERSRHSHVSAVCCVPCSPRRESAVVQAARFFRLQYEGLI